VAAYDEETMQMLRYFGGQLKHWRGLRNFTQDDFAKRVGYSSETVASIEQGRRVAQPPFFDNADKVLGALGSIKAAEEHIVRKTKYPAFFAEFAEAEQNAVSLDYYGAMAIPGLLQTEAYARAAIGCRCPAYDEDEVARLVQARMDRKALLTRKPPARLGFVIEEPVLRRPIGGRAVLKEQLTYLAEIARRTNVKLQVMPTHCEEPPGLEGAMTLLETQERQMVAYIEHQGGSQWVTKPAEFSVLLHRYGIIRAQALTTRDSLGMIEKMAGEL